MSTYHDKIRMAVGTMPQSVVVATEARMREMMAQGTLCHLTQAMFEEAARSAYHDVIRGIGTRSGRHDLFPGARS